MALAANLSRGSRGDIVTKYYLLASGVHCYQGSILMLGSDGYARLAAAAANNQGVPGIAMTEVNNTGADGAAGVEAGFGLFELPVTSTAQGEVGHHVFASDDNTTSDTQGSNQPYVGTIEEYISTSRALVRVGPEQHAKLATLALAAFALASA